MDMIGYMSERDAHDAKSELNYAFDRYGGFEIAKVTDFEEGCNSLFQTNANQRDFDRRKVIHCGEVPRKNQSVLLLKKTYNDEPISTGVSSWISS